MIWNQHHEASEQYAVEAEIAARTGNAQLAGELYCKAAEEESRALTEIDTTKPRTLGILAVSAASLWFKGGDLREAERAACQSLARDDLPVFAVSQLQTVLNSVWNERVLQEGGIEFAPGEVLVRITGGKVIHGAAPLELVHLKVEQIRGWFYRTIEMLLEFPLRRHGQPRTEIQQQFCPWLLHAPPASYQFAVRIQKPPQLPLFEKAGPDASYVVNEALRVLQAATAEEEQISEVVHNPDYVDVFLKLARDLSPTGKSFQMLEVRSAESSDARPMALTPESRQIVNAEIRHRKRLKAEVATELVLPEEQIGGVLRALHLDQDWLEIALSDSPDDHVKVYETGDVIDDIVGPLVNHHVLVDVAVEPDGRRLFRDIQSDE